MPGHRGCAGSDRSAGLPHQYRPSRPAGRSPADCVVAASGQATGLDPRPNRHCLPDTGWPELLHGRIPMDDVCKGLRRCAGESAGTRHRAQDMGNANPGAGFRLACLRGLPATDQCCRHGDFPALPPRSARQAADDHRQPDRQGAYQCAASCQHSSAVRLPPLIPRLPASSSVSTRQRVSAVCALIGVAASWYA